MGLTYTLDASPYQNNGQLVGLQPPVLDIPSPWANFNNAMTFNGTTGSGINCGGVPQPSALTPFTLEAKIVPQDIGSTGIVCGWYGAGDAIFGIWQNESDLLFYVVAPDTFSLSADALVEGQLYSVAADFDGTTAWLYANGSVVASGALSSGVTLGAEYNFWLGNGDINEYVFDGVIDEVRLSLGVARYGGENYTPDSIPFTVDSYTAALYHLDTTYSPPSPGGPRQSGGRAYTFSDLIWQLNRDSAPSVVPGSVQFVQVIVLAEEVIDVSDAVSVTTGSIVNTWGGGNWGFVEVNGEG